eukprot:359009-Chlamydomonas_euryale.AAC.7
MATRSTAPFWTRRDACGVGVGGSGRTRRPELPAPHQVSHASAGGCAPAASGSHAPVAPGTLRGAPFPRAARRCGAVGAVERVWAAWGMEAQLWTGVERSGMEQKVGAWKPPCATAFNSMVSWVAMDFPSQGGGGRQIAGQGGSVPALLSRPGPPEPPPVYWRPAANRPVGLLALVLHV